MKTHLPHTDINLNYHLYLLVLLLFTCLAKKVRCEDAWRYSSRFISFNFQIFKEGSPSAMLIFKEPSITKINKFTKLNYHKSLNY